MHHKNTRYQFSLVLIGVIFALAFEPMLGMGQLPTNIQQDLEKNAAALNPIQVSWTTKRQSELSRSTLEEIIGFSPVDQEEGYPITAKYMTAGQKYYVRFDHSVALLTPNYDETVEIVKEVQELAYNGTHFYFGVPKGPSRIHGKLNISTLEQRQKDTSPVDILLRTNYFRDAGFKIAEFYGDNIPQPESLILHMISNGATIESVDSEQKEGRTLTRVVLKEKELRHIFLLAPELGHAVVTREVQTTAGERVLHAELKKHRPVTGKGSVFLPYLCEVRCHKLRYSKKPPSEKVLFTEIFTVGEISTNDISDDNFDLHYDEPDTHILNATLANEDMRPDGGISYFVPKNPGDLDKVILKATEEAIMISEKNSASIRFRYLLITSSVLIIVCILALIYRRNRKTK